MKPRLLIIFLLLVLAPLSLLGWLGVRLAMDEQVLADQRVRELLERSLAETGASLDKLLAARARDLVRAFPSADQAAAVRLPASDGWAAEMRAQVRHSPIARQVFVLGPDCGRLHPPVGGPLTQAEREFVARARDVWTDMLGICRFKQEAEGKASEGNTLFGGGSPAASSGWYVWRWGGGGTDLIHWRRPAGGGLIGVELDSIRLLADIMSALPEGEASGRTALLDTGGQVLYQWGVYRPDPAEAARAELALAHPLSHLSLAVHMPSAEADKAAGSSITFSLVVLIAVAGLVLLLLAVYFYHQQARAMRQASQRVSFVNRVSHELRTPLTNIRLYAELLQSRLDEADEKTGRQLSVIVSESGRLSRLIGNVLAFSRQQKGSLALHRSRGRVDELIGLALEHFEAAMADKGVAVEFEAGAPDEILIDSDALGQILANLLSNAEKYLPAGGRVKIVSSLEAEICRIRVIDDGPGIPAREAERIFDPFYRVSDKLTDGVSGTGLGLGIARDLARLHGGDLVLMPSERGACFELSLHTPACGNGESS